MRATRPWRSAGSRRTRPRGSSSPSARWPTRSAGSSGGPIRHEEQDMRRNIRFLVPLFALVLFAAVAPADEAIVATKPAPASLEKAAFAGGCFWCMQGPYDNLPGVVSTTVGYNGSQYRTAIFFENDAQRAAAEASKKALAASGVLKTPIATEILKAGTFWKAEEYHQSYYKKNPIRYKFYRSGCGRDARLKEIWGAAAPRH